MPSKECPHEQGMAKEGQGWKTQGFKGCLQVLSGGATLVPGVCCVIQTGGERLVGLYSPTNLRS